MLKVKLSLRLTKHHAMKTYCGSGGVAPCILDLGTRWRSVISFTPRTLYPQGKSPWVVGSRAILDTVAKRKIPSPRRKAHILWRRREGLVRLMIRLGDGLPGFDSRQGQ
jgi:hypothetical protein